MPDRKLPDFLISPPFLKGYLGGFHKLNPQFFRQMCDCSNVYH
jgi:hypothetical protein